MEIVYGLLFICFACLGYSFLRISILSFKQIRTIREDKGFFIGGIVMGLLCIATSILAIWSFFQMATILESKGIKYNASEYNIKTEVTTRGEVSDTTYVITKIK